VVDQHLDQLRAYAAQRAGKELCTKEDPSDLVQSAVQDMLKRGGLVFEEEGACLAYLRKAIDNEILDRLRFYNRDKRQSAGEQPFESETCQVQKNGSSSDRPSQVAIRFEELERMRAAFVLLEPRPRDLLTQRYVHERSIEQIAASMGVSPSTVRKEICDAMTELSRRLAH
jgi:RNA polymerase sigma factor (sigma-70 family)